MQKLENKIEAKELNLKATLSQKYFVDYFQREYSWQKEQMQALITDLTSAFLNEYTDGDDRTQGENYNNYYLGPFVISRQDGSRSIIDGQQRLTSLTLFLIYLNHLQKENGHNEKIEEMIFSENRGKKSFNIEDERRSSCLKSLFENGEYVLQKKDDESVKNMTERYQEIDDFFPDELKKHVFPNFIDWLKYNVIMVEIMAYSDENAYAIFETMNDRGLNLTASEMLKGFLLSHLPAEKRQRFNDRWKEDTQELKTFSPEEDQSFFQAWLRAKYAETIRTGSAGAKNEDFEKIGTHFHKWVRDETRKLDLNTNSNFEVLMEKNLPFFLKAYLKILKAEKTYTPELEHVFYIYRYGIAKTLSFPLMLAPLNLHDSEEICQNKINTVAHYIECYVVRRSLNFKAFSQTSIRYTMYNLVKEIRGKNLKELTEILSKKLLEMDQSLDGIRYFHLHGQNKPFVKFLLSRITAWIEKEAGENSSFAKYYIKSKDSKEKPFEIEHIWANKFEQHSDEFSVGEEEQFKEYRNRLGALILLPQGVNHSLNDFSYGQKQPHYLKENLLAKSLCKKTYENNPSFKKMTSELNLPFKPYESFKKEDIEERQELYSAIAEHIWGSI